MKVTINDEQYVIPDEWHEAPLLTVLRDYLGLTGTKFGCGKGICGACTVHLNGDAIRSCILPVRAIGNASITTIEGLSKDGKLHSVQQAWIEESVPQCGYCQAGQMMTAAAYLSETSEPSAQAITQAMSGNLCRCGTYSRIRRGVARAAVIAKQSTSL